MSSAPQRTTVVRASAATAGSAESRLTDALECAREGMALFDVHSRVVMANSRMHELFPVVEQSAFLADGEHQLPDKRWLQVSRSVTRDGGFFLVVSDVSEVKERERRLVAAQEQAEAASRAKSSFLANMSHELRTPLNAIIGFAEIMSAEMFGKLGSTNYVQYATDILGSGRHLLDIINSVLDLAKSEAGKLKLNPEPIDLAEVIADCATMIRNQCARAGLEFDVAEPETPVLILGEAAKLRQIFLNLLSNAMKFTDPGGRVTFKTLNADNGKVAIVVADTGIGMTAADIAVALAPFGQVDSRLSRRYDGTGLGLPLAKALAELHDGVLEIVSVPKIGTTITVTLPVVAGASAQDTLFRAAS